MPDTWISDLSHFMDETGALVGGGPGGRFAQYLSRLVEAATAEPAETWVTSTVRCRRRPGRVPCPGRIAVRRTASPGAVQWECPTCGDRGRISGWEGSPWDRRGGTG